MDELRRRQSDVFAELPEAWPVDPLPAVRAALAERNQKVVVLDDDPTGTQTVHDVPVLTEWSAETLTAEFKDPGSAVFVLTNSRSMPLPEAQI
ncbi:MAG: hydroxyacid dehydrogenase, partial [Anaerolineae bacterium]|nr:hydroxyacid dehydrogenase [Anaerolineae bacterium]